MEKLKKYNSFINESSYINEFQILYDNAPENLQKLVDKTKDIKQSKKWHPEGDVYKHTKIVTNRLYNTYHDINLSISGFFHDLGKVNTTIWDEEKETWSAHGHEEESGNITQSYSNWIKKMGANPTIVEFIVQNHMKIKYLDEFRLQEKIRFLNLPLFNYVYKFASADYGGTDLNCNPLMDLTDINKDIEDYNIKEKENKIISSKFNGRIIMELYPELKGKSLGDIITNFKTHIGDFKQYVLNTNKEEIIKDFDIFYNQTNNNY